MSQTADHVIGPPLAASTDRSRKRAAAGGCGRLSWILVLALLAAAAVMPATAQEGTGSPGPLSAAHKGLDDPDSCDSCHVRPGVVEGERCLDCHDRIAERMTAGRGLHREATAEDCAVCHAEHQGRDADIRPLDRDDFDHAEETGFALSGSHAGLAGSCERCHTSRSFLELEPSCSRCHEDAHRGDHGTDCARCHTVDKPFRDPSRAFHSATLLPLQGRHLAVPCADCHQGGVFEGTPTDCHDCHWMRRQDDPFETRLGTDCESCHRPTSWTAVSWDHRSATGFGLSGAHLGLDCVSCHSDRRFEGPLVPDCAGCHLDDYERSEHPSHRQAGFPTDCVLCHSPADLSWHQADFAHPFEPVGTHATLDCADCHAGGVYQGLSPDCVGCHLDDYSATQSPNHAAAGFPTTCDSCHNAADPSWDRATYSHTVWPLVASHTAQPCNACHSSGVYQGLPPECADCHLDDYNATQDPDHGAAGFPIDCELCHTPTAWSNGSFTHPFQLVGSHTTLDCADCHTSGIYQGLPSECADCHLDDYNATRDPNHGAAGFPNSCDLCHTPTAWSNASFNHPYQLVGTHTTLDCADCHASGIYQGLPSDCVDCHLDDYSSSQDPNHAAAGFPTTCDSCHNPADSSWSQASFNHTAWPLVASHATQPCSACHASGIYQGLSSECVDCHLDDYNATDDPNHAAAGYPTTCEVCHTPTTWEGASAEHPYQLVGTHATLDCADCHASGVYQGLPSDCADCHLDTYNGTRNPDHAAAGFPTTCDSCHSAADPSWHHASYNHVVWPLVASHAAQPCSSCHASGVYQGLPSECVDCHLDDYNATRDPNHAAAGFPTTCEACHDPTSWEGASVDHPYRLVGTHATLDCADCHASGVYQGLPSDCADCHLDDYNATQDPNHGAAGFPTTCDSCHDPADPSWNRGSFSHNAWPLVASHATQPCSACHASGVYQGLASECVDCHLDDYGATQDPDHAVVGFPTTCELCHTPTAWGNATFNHPYQLVGTHATLDCSACHSSGIYQGLPSDCADCHLDDYSATQSPDHAAAGFPTTCDSCHDASDPSWNQGSFGHNAWPLVASHATQPCSACHSSGVYQGLPSECVDCHLDDYSATQDPDHAVVGFPTTCELCHTPTAWDNASFNHPFQLVGTHATLDCSACHSSGIYQGLPSDCADCHLDDYNATQSPDHAAAGFPTTCDSCHDASDPSWNQGSFGHNAWPLVASHGTQPCSACHASGVYQGLPSECVDCHLDDYNGTQDPDHAAAGFPTTCELCHTPTAWGNGSFNHPFQLVGTHATLDCSACHSGGVYQGLPSDCVDCHLDTYNATQDPDHAAAGFPTTCDSCHNPADPSWNQGSFSHAVWPLVATHASQPCTSCHSSGVYQGLASECVDCHLDDYSGTQDPDHAAAGFPTTCELCHTPTAWGNGSFNHPFQLVGTHATLVCAACHSGGVYQGLPSDCVDCHLDDYNATQDPDHAAAGFPTTCDSCHDPADPSFSQGSFSHAVWPLVASHATQPCTACHSSGVYQGLPSECVDCHLDDYNGTQDPDHAAAGFPTTCELCHDPTAWGNASFNHSYQLVGTHATLACAACHSSGIYQGLPSECVDCHLDDYNATQNPDHAAVGFPTTCTICHNASDGSWNQGSFIHSYFPINSGPHVIADCSDCHISSPNMAIFSCTSGGCHPRSSTSNNHSEVSGFVYDSPACYACHPNGQSQPTGQRRSVRRAI